MRAKTFALSVCVAAVLALPAVPIRIAAATTPSAPSERLRSETEDAFRRYVQKTDARNDVELRQGSQFLWIDGLPATEQAAAYEQLKRGEIKIRKLETREDGSAIRCPGGIIHHWVGAAFIPKAHLRDVLAILEDYDHQSTYYAPDVQQSRVESRDGDHFKVFLRFRWHKVITVVLNSEHDVRYFVDSDSRAHSRSSAIRIAEVENAGKDSEREKPPGDDNGFLWHMETWWRMIEKDGGVYVQSEVVSLSREIPTGLGWLVGPFVTSVPKESLTLTLEATRKAVIAKLH